MIRLGYKNFVIEFWEDNTYSRNSTDDLDKYEYVYCNNIDNECTHNIAIKIKDNEHLIGKAIVCVPGPFAGIHNDSIYIEHSMLWILAGKWMYCLQVPTFRLIWFKELDCVANFSLYRLEDDFLVHGELEVIRITTKGFIKWRFGGRDIWVNLLGRKEVTIGQNMIHLVDFENNEYTIDFEGKEIYSK